MAVFSYLAATFNYPDVLDGSAAEVLPKLLTLGDGGRAMWAVYAMLPFLLIPAALGTRAALHSVAPTAMRAAVISASITAVAMMLGLARWPSVHWELARAYPTAGAEARVAIDAVFLGLNVYLGNWIGEFVGEMALNGFFVLTGFAALRSPAKRGFGWAGIAAGVIGWIAAFRNVTSAVSVVAAADNYVLPLWLIVLGVMLLRWKHGPQHVLFNADHAEHAEDRG